MAKSASMKQARKLKAKAKDLKAKAKALAAKTATLRRKTQGLKPDARAVRTKVTALGGKKAALETKTAELKKAGDKLTKIKLPPIPVLEGLLALVEAVGELIGKVLAKLEEIIKLPGKIAKLVEWLDQTEQIKKGNMKLDALEKKLNEYEGKISKVAEVANTWERFGPQLRKDLEQTKKALIGAVTKALDAIEAGILSALNRLIGRILRLIAAAIQKIMAVIRAVQSKIDRVRGKWRKAKKNWRKFKRWLSG